MANDTDKKTEFTVFRSSSFITAIYIAAVDKLVTLLENLAFVNNFKFTFKNQIALLKYKFQNLKTRFKVLCCSVHP